MYSRFCWLFSLLIFSASHAFAERCIDLIPQRNQLPMPSIFLELELESACILEAGIFQSSLNLQRSNTTTISPDKYLNNSRLILDHEREEVTIKTAVGLSSGWDMNLRFRHIKDWEGNWDGFMRRFHQVTGLPYESRKVRPDGEFLYFQNINDKCPPLPNTNHEECIWITKNQQGQGDHVLTLRRQHGSPFGSTEVKWNTRIVYKHPSADDLPTISSGKKDFGISTATEGSEVWFGQPVRWLFNIGGVHTGQTKHTLYSQNRTFFSGGAALSTPYSKKLTLTVQNLVASPRYRAPGLELKGMNQWQSILGLGAFYHLEKHSLMFGFSEDLLTNHSEDFSLIFSWLGSFRE